ncbi:uncharacterized protein EAF01_007285 [Botrytis porri]|uniref:Uncharacterized protein n=1 Tax=Botrytis porri TaxID=87229 RepID=A0A4Z1KBX4_9HELO|nr:uncharacterized protein EAF01_007285 [Botrytis porri]KAF7901987.1 hypothetical protein EAF01_007285 [Botrytis porri]TGO81032.1 hypothetical protein BPOR_1404g00020 [Botrytis porri]
MKTFRLSNASDLARETKSRSTITRHDLDAKNTAMLCNTSGYYVAATVAYEKTNTKARKSKTAKQNCKAKTRCANFFGPFPAGH